MGVLRLAPFIAMKFTYKHTVLACYIAYISSACANNLASLLFIIFQDDFGLTTVQLATIVTLNFFTQIIVDFLGARYIDKVGYRATAIIASGFLVVGIACLGALPRLIPNTFLALCIASVVYAVGSALYEVIISPIVEALPGEQKESAMSILHSFYCWGHVGVVILSTAFLVAFPKIWHVLPILWAVVPMLALLLFTKIPIRTLNDDAPSMKIGALFKTKLFWLFIALMLCGGAAEMTMAQWSSLFAESALGVSKAIGNLLGPCFFALMMALTRTFYGKYAEKMPLVKVIALASAVTVIGYLTVALVPNPYVALIGCGIIGVGVALYWPGTLSVAAKALPMGGASMFALLALFGDVGCSVGPQLSAFVAEGFGGNMKIGFIAALVFPIVIGISCILYMLHGKKSNNN